MTFTNTTGSHDKAIELAETAEDHVENMISIIGDLDEVINEWRKATGCDTPDEAAKKIEDLEESQ